MAVRIRSQIVVVASLDTDEKQVHFERQDKSLTSVIQSYDAEESGQLILTGSEANYTIPMGKVSTGALLYIEADQEVTVRLNGEVAGHKVKPTAGVKAKLYLNGEFVQAPIVSNNATVEANVSYLIAGAKA